MKVDCMFAQNLHEQDLITISTALSQNERENFFFHYHRDKAQHLKWLIEFILMQTVTELQKIFGIVGIAKAKIHHATKAGLVMLCMTSLGFQIGIH